ncbi:oligopeptide/dipeptide ABC transporter ATP-binding protein [Streptomyces virginiae]|uniref:oligopeptide/dipeptide ABC transporter ATP-binding protein n=1 Tax=Streptomyces virginiae TaxID=1961 RepID=UPI000526061A|nr:oligopeptide/dipeptide ABC transporter ATP-binding protein [Streptomyces virginiae]
MAELTKNTTEREPILQVRNLVKHFPLTQGILFKKQVGAVKAVDGISFDLYQGETLGIVGESGCGKSTVAKLLMNLERATAGEIFYKGQDISKLSGRALKAVRRNIQMVFQDPYTSLNPRMTVGDIIGEPYEIHPEVAPKGNRRQKVQMAEIGTDAEIYEHPTHPYTQALLSAVPVPDPDAREGRERIILTGDVPSPANPPSGCRFRTRCWKAQDKCSTEEPLLAIPERFKGVTTLAAHESACHFAEEKAILAV